MECIFSVSESSVFSRISIISMYCPCILYCSVGPSLVQQKSMVHQQHCNCHRLVLSFYCFTCSKVDVHCLDLTNIIRLEAWEETFFGWNTKSFQHLSAKFVARLNQWSTDSHTHSLTDSSSRLSLGKQQLCVMVAGGWPGVVSLRQGPGHPPPHCQLSGSGTSDTLLLSHYNTLSCYVD